MQPSVPSATLPSGSVANCHAKCKWDGKCRPIEMTPSRLQNLNVLGLQALGTFGHIELDRLAFLQAAETVCLDRGVMNENILARLPRDKAKTF